VGLEGGRGEVLYPAVVVQLLLVWLGYVVEDGYGDGDHQ